MKKKEKLLVVGDVDDETRRFKFYFLVPLSSLLFSFSLLRVCVVLLTMMGSVS